MFKMKTVNPRSQSKGTQRHISKQRKKIRDRKRDAVAFESRRRNR